MAESGNRPAVRILQRRLSIMITILGFLGCLALGLIWWDSTENLTTYSTARQSIGIGCSSIVKETKWNSGGRNGYWRANVQVFIEDQPLFPRPRLSSHFVRIPIYLLILSYLASLFLMWVVLMTVSPATGAYGEGDCIPLAGDREMVRPTKGLEKPFSLVPSATSAVILLYLPYTREGHFVALPLRADGLPLFPEPLKLFAEPRQLFLNPDRNFLHPDRNFLKPDSFLLTHDSFLLNPGRNFLSPNRSERKPSRFLRFRPSTPLGKGEKTRLRAGDSAPTSFS